MKLLISFPILFLMACQNPREAQCEAEIEEMRQNFQVVAFSEEQHAEFMKMCLEYEG